MKVAFQIAIQAGIPVLFSGPPGVGKSASVMAFCKALGDPCEVVIASVREPSDFAGLPIVTPHGVILEAPAWAKKLAHAGRGVAFLDEITCAPPAVQAALLKVVLDRTVGDLQLPESVRVVAACNPTEQSAGGWDLSAPLANRFCHLRWQMDHQNWSKGMISGWPPPEVIRLPEDWQKKHLFQASSLVASFIMHRPQLLLQVPKEEANMGKAWPSNRTWTMSAHCLAACDSVRADKEAKMELIAGCVGEGPAIEFVTWSEELDLPDPEFVLANPDSFKIPARGDRAYAALAAIAAAVLSNNTAARWQAGLRLMVKAHEKGIADIAASAVLLLANDRPPRGVPPPEISKFWPMIKIAERGNG